jgi:hypothetical protein
MLNVYLLYLYAKCILDYFHICIRSTECEINEMKCSKGSSTSMVNQGNLNILYARCYNEKKKTHTQVVQCRCV